MPKIEGYGQPVKLPELSAVRANKQESLFGKTDECARVVDFPGDEVCLHIGSDTQCYPNERGALGEILKAVPCPDVKLVPRSYEDEAPLDKLVKDAGGN